MTRKKVAFAAIVAAIAMYVLLDLGRFLNLEYLKQSQSALAQLREKHSVVVPVIFFLIYVLPAG